MHHLRFRQIHLDFHTSPAIPGIGTAFNKAEYQATLKAGFVDSITTFSKCHHGWSYHPTKVGRMHPHLSYDLLKAQYEASKEINVNVPIYISAGVDNVASYEHPEWREVNHEGRYAGWTSAITSAGFHKMCFNSPYLDYLCEQIREVVHLYPQCDGIFLDIISQGQCCCKWCLAVMAEQGLDATLEADRKKCAHIGLERYYRDTTAACLVSNPKMPVFHNSGHISRGDRGILKYFSHLELESLPTGGWGYDHFPMSAKYCSGLGLDFLGMTGKFHTTWGEFGGFKHPNALRYECAAMLAYGSKCSVGDQLHPDGKLDASTYAIIGAAYREVAAKEPWCDHVRNVADIGLLSSTSVSANIHNRDDAADVGATRLLLEGHFLFDVLDGEMDFNAYKMLILPDEVVVTPALKAKLDAYLAQGGKLFLTGQSGLNADATASHWDFGGTVHGLSPFQPDYVLPLPALRADFVESPMVMYRKSVRLKVAGGQSLGVIHDPYFNRDFRHFCSHQHTPNKQEASGFACGVQKGAICYLAHPVFSLYRLFGQVALKDFVVKCLRSFLGDQAGACAKLPSTARLSLMEQAAEKRYILHLLYANTVARGGGQGGRSLEVVEDLQPLCDSEVTLRLPKAVKRATLEPQGQPLALSTKGNTVTVKVDRFTCHQMVVLHC